MRLITAGHPKINYMGHPKFQANKLGFGDLFVGESWKLFLNNKNDAMCLPGSLKKTDTWKYASATPLLEKR